MRSLKSLFAFSIAASLALVAMGADAAGGKKDKDVQKLVNQAMDDDYLNVEFEKAEAKLKKALDTCNKDKDNCSPEVLGKVHVGLATVHGVGQQKLDVAKADLIAALKADPGAKLIEGLAPPELEAKYKEAKAEVGGAGGGGEGGKGGEGGEGGEGGKGGGNAGVQADFDHKPPAESAVNTPVPIFAELPEEVGATKVIVRFKAFGGNKWESLPLTKIEGGWGAEVPCAAVTTTGDLRYFIVGSDENGVVATAGSMKAPFKIPIRSKITGDAPSLPGKNPPKKCAAKEDCPPGLEGCAGADAGKPEGAICDATSECGKGLGCLNGICTPTGEEPEGESKGTQHVISLGAQFDIAYVGDGRNVCSPGSSGNYICTSEANSDQQFFGRPADIKGTNGISGGLAFGGARIFAGYDYFFKFGLGLGARVGYAIGGPTLCTPGEDGCPKVPDLNGDGVVDQKDQDEYPAGKSYFPAHLEARASWKFLHPNPEAGDFAPHVFVGGGGAQVNASIPVRVCDEVAEGGPPGCPGQTKVNAYQLTGLTFITFGGGATYMFIKNFGLTADVKFMVLFPTVGFTISPTISPLVAF